MNTKNTAMRLGWSEKEIDASVTALRIAMESDWIMDGEATLKWKLYLNQSGGLDHTHFVSSATSGLELLLKALTAGVSGVKILTLANNWPSMIGAMFRAGCTPIFVDMNMPTLLPNPVELEQAIIRFQPLFLEFAHLGGRIDPAVVGIRDICYKYGVKTIEDYSHCLGVTEDGTGRRADYIVRSFGALKLASAGCGGSVSSNVDGIINTVAMMSRYGRQKEFGHSDTVTESYSSRYNELSAAISWALYRNFDFDAVMNQCKYYEAHIDHEKFKTFVDAQFNGYKYILAGRHISRDKVKAATHEANLTLATGVWEETVLPLFPDVVCANNLPVTRSFCKYNFSLPTYPELPMEVVAEFVDVLNGIEP